MADNTNITPGSGEIVRTIDLGGGIKQQAIFQAELWPITSALSSAGAHVQSVPTTAGGQPLPNIPIDTTHALLYIETNDIRWLDDGQVPTTAIGMKLTADSYFWISGRARILAWKMIAVTATATATVMYYKYT
jgi:hypothetical protein